MEHLLKSVFDTDSSSVIAVGEFFLCLGFSVVLGLIIALTYSFRSKTSKSFVITLSLLPTVVCVIIMMVNGNIGTGVAVAGAFSLVRFRSVPGTAKEICMLFLCMGAGLISGMGYLGFSLIFTVIVCIAYILYDMTNLGSTKNSEVYKQLSVTIPEDINYTDVFDDLFEQYTLKHELIKVKTTNMGSMFKLTYRLCLKNTKLEKEFIDKLRCRNGNLEINISSIELSDSEL